MIEDKDSTRLPEDYESPFDDGELPTLIYCPACGEAILGDDHKCRTQEETEN